jgi:hypothetical protein
LSGLPDIIVLNRIDAVSVRGWHTIFIETKREGKAQQANQKIVSDLLAVFAPTRVVDTYAAAEALGLELTGTTKLFKRR